MRDDDIIRRAQLWATGATVHDVNSMIGLYRSGVALLEKYQGNNEEETARAEDAIETARCRLEDLMRHGDYRKAKEANPFRHPLNQYVPRSKPTPKS